LVDEILKSKNTIRVQKANRKDSSMTRSKLIAMLQTSATSLNALGNKTPTNPSQPVDPADTQVASTILQLILQILEGILAEQPPAGQTPADLQQETATLMHALTDTLTGVHAQNAKAATGGTVDIGGVQVNILQIIIQILQSILLQNSGTTVSTPAPVEAMETTDTIAKPDVLEPRVTADSAVYAYDLLGRLISVTLANSDEVVYNYDSVGNRTSVVTTL
jgi:YD repeat-containing protein